MSEAGPAGPSSTPARSPTTDSDEISESLGRSEVAKVFRHDHRPVLIQDELFGHATEELEVSRRWPITSSVVKGLDWAAT